MKLNFIDNSTENESVCRVDDSIDKRIKF